MKKIIVTLVAVFAIGAVSAQEAKFGVKAGLNLANWTGDVEETKTKVGFNVGGFVEIKVSEKFSVQPELLYSAQGTDFDGETYSFGYINIPVMAKFYVAKSFSLEAGPQVGFLISAKAKEDGSDEKVDIKEGFESVDFGLNFGAGYDFTEKFSVGVRYNLGLSNIVKDAPDSFKINNSVLSLSVGYKF